MYICFVCFLVCFIFCRNIFCKMYIIHLNKKINKCIYIYIFYLFISIYLFLFIYVSFCKIYTLHKNLHMCVYIFINDIKSLHTYNFYIYIYIYIYLFIYAYTNYIHIYYTYSFSILIRVKFKAKRPEGTYPLAAPIGQRTWCFRRPAQPGPSGWNMLESNGSEGFNPGEDVPKLMWAGLLDFGLMSWCLLQIVGWKLQTMFQSYKCQQSNEQNDVERWNWPHMMHLPREPRFNDDVEAWAKRPCARVSRRNVPFWQGASSWIVWCMCGPGKMKMQKYVKKNGFPQHQLWLQIWFLLFRTWVFSIWWMRVRFLEPTDRCGNHSFLFHGGAQEFFRGDPLGIREFDLGLEAQIWHVGPRGQPIFPVGYRSDMLNSENMSRRPWTCFCLFFCRNRWSSCFGTRRIDTMSTKHCSVEYSRNR